MWHTNPNTNQSQNLPSVLKNFNAFDVLEPEKVNHESIDVSTAVLIDVTDSMNRQEKFTDLGPDLHGSFLEKVKKTEFDLLDLYQNIYVTPQEIKKEPRDDCRCKNKNSDPSMEAFKIDFTELFEKAEQGKKLSESPKQNENLNEVTKNIPQLNLTNKNSRSFDEILDDAISSRCSQLKLDPPPKLELDIPKLDPICEDDIDDFLQPKLVIDPSIFEETTQNMCSNGSLSHFNNDTPPVTSLSLNDRRQNILKSLSKPIKATFGDKPSNNISKVCPEKQGIPRSVYNHDVKSQIPFTLQESNIYENKTCSSKIEPQSDVTPIYRKQLTTNLTDLNSPPMHRSTCQETIPILHTVKMDPKAYLKRRIVKKDAEKIGFTKGPDIYEKSIVLPQIMKRLTERKQGMEEQQIQRKLILESSDKHDQIHNCDDLNGAANNKKCMKVQTPEAPIKKATYLMHECCKEERPSKLGAYQKSEGFLKPEMSLKPPAYYLEPNTSVGLNPKVLMEDCSLKRVKALQTRIAFEKFVNTGKLPP